MTEPNAAAAPALCTRCRHPNRARARFCDECGAPLAADAHGDRRQAIVLFTDISGYTALCTRSDPEQVQRMLTRFYEAMDAVVAAYKGRVFDRAGDAVMAVFGAPVAHGNDAERALRAALDMHAAASQLHDCEGQPLRLHIGVASGEVVAAVISAGGKSSYSVTGDTVNLAARLDALAASGETLVSDALYQNVATVVEATSLGMHCLKGLAEPVPVWRVTGLRAAPLQGQVLVGRDAELAQLLEALDQTSRSGSGVTIALRGDAGIGKSRLLEEIRTRAEAQHFGTPSGHVLDFGIGRGQDAIASILKAALGIPLAADAAARQAAVQQAVRLGSIAAGEELFVNDLLAVPQPASLQTAFDAMDNTTRTQRSSAALAAVLQRAARVRPMLVSLEDLHWASVDVLRHAAAIAAATAHAPLILVLSTRIDGDPLNADWRANAGGSRWLAIELTPLRPDAAHRLARGLMDGAAQFVAQCVERAEGNPLFLEQLLNARHASDAAGVPPTIQSVVLERVDRLAGPDRNIIQAASVIGKRFSLDSVRAVLDGAAVACDALLAADLIRRDSQGLMFAHALIQEAVYSSTLKSVRRELHRKAAAWFADAEPVLRAEHLDRADDAGAAQAYLTAAMNEARYFRFDAALRLAERGAELAAATVGGEVACGLALLRGDMLREMGRSSESIAQFGTAAELARDDLQRCHAWMGVAAGCRITGDFESALQALSLAQPIAERLGRSVECSQIHHTRGNLLFAQGKVDACEAEHELALAHAVRTRNVDCEAQALSGLGDAQYARGRMRSALAYFQRCVALCAGGARVRIEGPNRCMTGHCLWYQNRLGSAIEEARRACDDAHRYGAVPVQVFAQTSLTQFLTEAGRIDEAERASEQGLALARAAGSRRYESTLLFWLAGVRLAQGQREHARRYLETALVLAQETGMGFIGPALYARLARALDAPADRADALRQGQALLLGPGLAHCHLWFYRDAIEASIETGEWEAALRHADALESFVSAEPLPWATSIATRARALCELALGRDRTLAAVRLREVRSDLAAAGLGWTLAAIDSALTGLLL